MNKTAKLSDLAKQVFINVKPSGKAPPDPEWQADGWAVELVYKGRRLVTDYWTGLGRRHFTPGAKVEWRGKWCSDLGENPDSRKALATYLACQESGARLRKLLGADFEAFRGAENDV